LSINQQYLDHDTYTDIISFDTSEANELSGDIFISVERIKENAKQYNVDLDIELQRVLAHGILHFCGYKDKTVDEGKVMREKEDEKLKMFHVEQ
jgi:rRNA maturation RNase YbeY